MANYWGRMPLILVLGFLGCGPSITTLEGTPASPAVTGSCSGGPTSASVLLFQENPRTASGNSTLPFGSSLSSAWTVGATLAGLRGNCLVDNGAFRVVADDFYPSSIAVANSTNLAYTPDRPEFRQLSSIWWATSTRDLGAQAGANLSSFAMVDIIAHCAVSSNAYFSPTYREICLGYKSLGGGKYVWAAEDGDVVVHETGHALNHELSGTDALNSSGEAGAIDEAVADYWALTYFGNSKIGEWFLGSIGSSLVRDASASHIYPGDMVYEVHDDSRVLTEALWELRKSTRLGKVTTDSLVRQTMELMPSTIRYQEFYLALETAASSTFMGLSPTALAHIRDVFSAKGIHRTDSVSSLRLDGTVPVRIIDDHSVSVQSGGNCNGQLDVGETALVLLNLENPQHASMGVVVATLKAPYPAGVEVPSYGGWGEFFKFYPQSNFLASLASTSGSARDDATLGASFLIKATTAGPKAFTVNLRPVNTGLSQPIGVNLDHEITITLSVGTTAPATSCSNEALWP